MGLSGPPVTTAFTRSQRRGELGAGGATGDRRCDGTARLEGTQKAWVCGERGPSFGSNGTARTISSRGRQRGPGARESCSSFLGT